MSNKWKVFWIASFAFVVLFQACGWHSWQEALVSTADEKQMGREFDSLVRIGHKDVIDASKGEKIFVPQTAAEQALYDYYQARAIEVRNAIDQKDWDGILPSGNECGRPKQKCTKENFFEFNIITSPTINAFAVPGGYVYFYTAILKNFQSESELVSVLGHEVGHVVKHHSRDRIVKQVGASAIIELLLGPGIGGTLAALGASFWLTSNGQGDESESDELGFYYTNKIGISSEGLGDFFGRGLKSYDPVTGQCDEGKESSILDVFSTHPPSCERVNNNRKRIIDSKQNFPKNKNFVDGKGFTDLVAAAGI
jgi:Zn-dependent protease with chaperone function